VGLACYAQGTGLGPFEGTTVRVDASGKVYVLVGVAAQGQGHATTLAQVCAQELGAAFEDVIVTAGDTTLFPFGMGTGGSCVMVNAGPAVANTARARERAASSRPSSRRRAPRRASRSRAFVTGMLDSPCRWAAAQAAVRPAARRPPYLGYTPARTTIPTPSRDLGTQAAVVDLDGCCFGYAVVRHLAAPSIR
jgi:CO/xanthine dehydrogenase Mo-binding subunit